MTMMTLFRMLTRILLMDKIKGKFKFKLKSFRDPRHIAIIVCSVLCTVPVCTTSVADRGTHRTRTNEFWRSALDRGPLVDLLLADEMKKKEKINRPIANRVNLRLFCIIVAVIVSPTLHSSNASTE